MASIHSYMTKQGKKYRAEIRRHSRHLKATKSRSFDTKREAETWAKHAEQELKTNPPQTVEQPQTQKTVSDLIIYYRKHCQEDKKPHTQRAQNTLLKFWQKQLGTKVLTELTTADINHWKKYLLTTRNYKDGTCRQYLSILRTMLRVAINDLTWLEKSPMTKVKLPQDSPARENSLSIEDTESLLQASKKDRHPMIYPFIYLASRTGLRYGEVLNIRLDHISWSARTIKIPQTKSGQQHIIYLTDEVLAVINNHILRMLNSHPKPYNWRYVRREAETGTLFYSDDEFLFPAEKTDRPAYLIKAWRRARREAGLDNGKVVFHSLRHFVGSTLANDGASDFEIASMLNHRDYRSTRRYTHASPQRIKANFERVARILKG